MRRVENLELRPLLFGLSCTLLILALGWGPQAQADTYQYQTVPTPTPPTIPTSPTERTPRPPDEAPPASPGLLLTKKARPPDILPQEELEFSLWLTNTAASAITGIILTDPLDPALHLLEVSATQGAAELSGGTLLIHLGTLEAGQTVLIVIRTRVAAETRPGQIILNQATAIFDGGRAMSNVAAAGLPPDRLPATGQERREP
jgi:uncharacterized repeat protein (TIGR01451 family)